MGVLATLWTLVAERRRDLAIRSAVGAAPDQLLSLVVRHGVRLAAMGVGCGTVVGLGVGRLLGSLLYGVTFYDPVTVLGTAAVVMVVTLSLLTYLAGRRARNVDVVAVLKSE